jgi:hypothetical protein
LLLRLHTLIIWLLWLLFWWALWNWGGQSVEYVRTAGLNSLESLNRSMSEWEALGWVWLQFSAFAWGKMIIVMISIRVVQRLPIPIKWVKAWDESGELSPILGRMIAYHWRHHSVLGVRELKWMWHHARNQFARLSSISKSPEQRQLIEKYDTHAKTDYEFLD